MANQFSSKKTEKIPKTLEACLVSDNTVIDLYDWAYRIENWGKIFFIVLIAAGVVSTIVEAVSLIDNNESMILPTIISSVITWGVYAFIEFCAYQVLALLINAVALITQNTEISAKVALFENFKRENNQQASAPAQQPVAAPEAPKEDRSSPDTVKAEPQIIDNAWTCPKCRRQNLAARKTCWSCDYQR